MHSEDQVHVRHQLYLSFASQNNDEICKQINVCPSAEPLKLVQVKLPDSDTVCDVCKEVVPYLRKLADSSMVEVSPRPCLCMG